VEDLEDLPQAVLIVLNQVTRTRDTVYLDTNAWSLLAKGVRPVAPLAAWLNQNKCIAWLARMQLAELSASPRVLEGLAHVLEQVPVVLLDRGQNELDGAPWNSVRVELSHFLHLTSQDLKDEFVKQFSGPNFAAARAQLAADRDAFGALAAAALAATAAGAPRGWHIFPDRVKRWVEQICSKNGRTPPEEFLLEPTRYIGTRLSYAVLFVRYVQTGQPWHKGDYLDYLHAADMAYARVVVTERNMAHCIREAMSHSNLVGPDLVVDTSWLNAPSN
jgi:hypothetical protein